MKISLVIAVYRNEGSICKTYEKIKSVFAKSLAGYEYEIIFVDDGSDDDSLKEIFNVRKEDSRVKAISFTRNFGQMAAILAGLKEASGDAVINISADMQDPVEMIPKMIKSWRKGSEIVACYRVGRSDTFAAKFFSRLAYGALKLSFPQLPIGGFDYVLIDRKPLDEYNTIDIRNRSFQGDLLWTGYRTCFIPYTRLKRTIGKSQYNFSKKLKNFLDAFLDASYLPIRFISLSGIITSIVGVIYGLTIIYAWFVGKTPFTGWAPIMVAILFVGGLIMIMLGVIGEYTWRIYSELRKKPNYVIRKKYL
ncbi:MAG: glycosyltransferase family 2 protein [Candidatus Shapirobacteria bacterium]|jgi:dolichol-phosphate mannosyltransferase